MKIHAIQTGTVIIRPNQREGVGSGDQRYPNILNDSRWTEPLPINVWVIEHPEGNIVIDTGETSKASSPGYFPDWHPYWKNVKEDVKPEEEVGPQLQRLGINPDEVWRVNGERQQFGINNVAFLMYLQFYHIFILLNMQYCVLDFFCDLKKRR